MMEKETKIMLKSWGFWNHILRVLLFISILTAPSIFGAVVMLWWLGIAVFFGAMYLFYQIGKSGYYLEKDK